MANARAPKVSIDYAITFTLKSKHFKLKPETQLEYGYAEIHNKLLGTGSLYTIVAEFTKAYNIHFHAIIKRTYYDCKDIERSFYDLFRNCLYIGFIYVKPVDDFHGWTSYMLKNVKDTYKKLICAHPVPKNDYKLEYELGLTEPLDEASKPGEIILDIV